MSKIKLLMGASALVAAGVSMAGTASAVTQVYGGGGTLIAPYLRQAEDCYGNPVLLVFKDSTQLHNPTTQSVAAFNYAPPPPKAPLNCATTHVDTNTTLNYIGTGSGAGIGGLYSHSAVNFWGDTVPGMNPSPYPTVNYATSDNGLAATDVTIYNLGGTEQGASVKGVNNPGGVYPNPQATYGNLIQYPLLIAPVAFGYSPVYKKVLGADGTTVTSYSFNVKKPRADHSGGLVVDAGTYCKIFNGQITNWNDPALKALNSNTSLRATTDPTPEGTPTTPGTWEYTGAGGGVPMQIVGRSDNSGTTSIFYRHLANVCASLAGNNYTTPGTALPPALYGAVWDKVTGNYTGTETLGKFTRTGGNDGVAKYLAFSAVPTTIGTAGQLVQGRLGYVGPDYVLPAVTFTGANTYGLNSTNIQRVDSGTGKIYSIPPTAKNALLAFGTGYLPPQSTSTGAYSAGVTANGLRANPQDWVQPPSASSPLANPSAIAAYPVVGTTNYLGYTCYSDAAVTASLIGFLKFYETSGVTTDATYGLIGKAGFSPLPKAWLTAIQQTFLVPVTATKPLNLNILQAGTGPASGTGSQCNAVTVGG